MKKSILGFLLITSATCWAGPYVSEGPGPVGTIMSCTNEQGETAFEIRHTAAITFIDGVFYGGGANPPTFECRGSDARWVCEDLRSQGQGLLHVETNRRGHKITAEITQQDDILGGWIHLTALDCQLVGN